jgi:hypothetical protein
MKPELNFYDVKSRTKFASTEWRIEVKTAKGKTRYFAARQGPNAGHEAWLIVMKNSPSRTASRLRRPHPSPPPGLRAAE